MNWWTEDMDQELEMIPEGSYEAKLHNVTCDETKVPSKLTLQWKISKGDHEGRMLFQNFTISEKSAKWLHWQLGTIGVWQVAKEVVDESGLTRALFDAASGLIGKCVVMLDVEHNFFEKTGKTYANAKITDLLSSNEPNFDTNDEIPF